MTAKIVKSVGRVFDILELFDRERRPLSATTISRLLRYPHSSTVAIVKSMQKLGYLVYDRNVRAYSLSAKLPQIAEWIVTDVHTETTILNVMADLHAEIDETINLSRHTGDFVKIVHGLESSKLLGIRVQQGIVMPLTGSHTGMVALSTYPDDEVENIIGDLRRRKYPQNREVTPEQALREVRAIRAERLSRGYDVYVDGIGIIAFPLVSANGARPFVVAIAGPTERMRTGEDEILRAAREIIERHGAELAYPD